MNGAHACPIRHGARSLSCSTPELQHSCAGLEQPASCCSCCLQCAMVSSRSFGLQMLQSPELILSLLLTCARLFLSWTVVYAHLTSWCMQAIYLAGVLGARANPWTVH